MVYQDNLLTFFNRGKANAAASGTVYKSERSKQNGAAFMVLLGEVNSVNVTYRLESQFAVSQFVTDLKIADLVYKQDTAAAADSYRGSVFTAFGDYCDDYWRLTGRYNDAIATINSGGTVSLTHFETSSPNQAYGQNAQGSNNNGQSNQSNRGILHILNENILALKLAGRYMLNNPIVSKPKSFPGASDIIFNHPSVQTVIMYAQEEIKRHFRDNPASTSYEGKRPFDFRTDSWNLLEWGLANGTLGFEAVKDGKKVTVTYTFYDDIKVSSISVSGVIRKRGGGFTCQPCVGHKHHR